MTANSILLVDDDTELSDMLAEYLQPEGMSITAAATGTRGLRYAQQEDYDLIVLDVMLPGLSGFDVLRQLRESGSRTPILMLTARGDDVDRIVGLEMGADDYLATLHSVGAVHLSDAVRLYDEEFDLVRGGYYVRRS